MAKNYSDLFERLRSAGVRKQVAKTLCEIDKGASKKAQRLGRSAVDEFRALADEIERRLPHVPGGRSTTVRTAPPAAPVAAAPVAAAPATHAAPRVENTHGRRDRKQASAAGDQARDAHDEPAGDCSV